MMLALSQGWHKLRRFARQYNVFEDGPNRDIDAAMYCSGFYSEKFLKKGRNL
jgi:hypothetical protein